MTTVPFGGSRRRSPVGPLGRGSGRSARGARATGPRVPGAGPAGRAGRTGPALGPGRRARGPPARRAVTEGVSRCHACLRGSRRLAARASRVSRDEHPPATCAVMDLLDRAAPPPERPARSSWPEILPQARCGSRRARRRPDALRRPVRQVRRDPGARRAVRDRNPLRRGRSLRRGLDAVPLLRGRRAPQGGLRRPDGADRRDSGGAAALPPVRELAMRSADEGAPKPGRIPSVLDLRAGSTAPADSRAPRPSFPESQDG